MIGGIPVAGQVIAVMGLGKSGLASARALIASGAIVRAWDDSAGKRAEAAAEGIPLVDLNQGLDGVQSLVLSPGIPHTHPAPNPVAGKARWAGIEIIGDVELLGRADAGAHFLGITGTNGKSTTTALLGHIFKTAGVRAAVGGNLGPPVLAFDRIGPEGWYVLELSSYQLELTFSVAHDVAVLLNITPDHLDRHGGLDGYVAAKSLIFGATRPDRRQTAVVGIDDPYCQRIACTLGDEGRWAVVRVSAENRASGGVYCTDGLLIDAIAGPPTVVMDLAEAPALPGKHNWQNGAAAYAAARVAGVDRETITAAIRSFPGLAHRQERVGARDGILFVNDSKATNADAASKALGCYDDIYWILGGRAKDGGLDGLEPLMQRVRHAFLIGEASERFAAWLSANDVAHTCCGSLPSAVAAAWTAARAGQCRQPVVLLSPACASFDQFPNFEARGAAFAEQVSRLIQGEVPA